MHVAVVGWQGMGASGGKDECKKQAKMFLKRQQGNLQLWAAFAAAEAARNCQVQHHLLANSFSLRAEGVFTHSLHLRRACCLAGFRSLCVNA